MVNTQFGKPARPAHQTKSRLTSAEQEELNNYYAEKVNLNSPNWSIPVGNKPVQGDKNIFYLTNVNRIRKTKRGRKGNKKTRKNHRD
jgi:hypothetical protein